MGSSTQSTYQDHLYSSQYHHSLLGVQKHYQKTTTTRQHDGYTHQPPSVAKTQLLHHLDTAQCGPRHGGTSVRETFLVKGQSACGLGAPDQTYWRAICHVSHRDAFVTEAGHFLITPGSFFPFYAVMMGWPLA